MNVGLIMPGFSADLMILDENPVADIRNTQKIASIYHRGQLVAKPAPKN
jgi:imidazolonepropionase-like amidohydrolase